MAKLRDRVARLELKPRARRQNDRTKYDWTCYAALHACQAVTRIEDCPGDPFERLYRAISSANLDADKASPIRANLRKRLWYAKYLAVEAPSSRDDKRLHSEIGLKSLGFEQFYELMPSIHPELVGPPKRAGCIGQPTQFRIGLNMQRGWGYRVEHGKLWFDSQEIEGPHIAAFGINAWSA